MDDETIVGLYLARSETALSLTAEHYGSRLRALAQSIVQDLETAKECENDTYLQAWNHIPPQNPAGYFYAFLARITRNLALNVCRNRSRLKRAAQIRALDAELEQCIPSPDNTACRVEDHLLAEAINDFLAGLEPEKRGFFVRRYWYLDSIEAIARRYGVTKSKVKTDLYRSRKQLFRTLESKGWEL